MNEIIIDVEKKSVVKDIKNLKTNDVDLRKIAIKDSLFENNKAVKKIGLPVISGIGKRAFYNSILEEVNFQDQEDKFSIGKKAFAESNLKSITFPKGTFSIQDKAFKGTDLKEITFLGEIPKEGQGEDVFVDLQEVNDFKWEKYNEVREEGNLPVSFVWSGKEWKKIESFESKNKEYEKEQTKRINKNI